MRLNTSAMVGLGGLLIVAGTSHAGIDPLSGIDFVHVGSAGNAAWTGDGTSGDLAIGHGSVGYEYNIGKFEVTTAQWTQFYNAVYDRSTPLNNPYIHAPQIWGAVQSAPTNPGGLHWTVPAGNEMIPVGGISWRTAAIYCNWLCNGKSTDPSAFTNGAYDISTFHDLGNGFTDQVTHNANAQYWIPTFDEYIKAAHYDPNRNGPGQGGYWLLDSTISHFPIAGPPGTGEANYGFTSPNPFTIPLGSYPTVTSPWGLLDTAGGTSEWTEMLFTDAGQSVARGFEGSYWGSPTNAALADTIYTPLGGEASSYRDYSVGFRIASSVPAPGTCIVLAGVFTVFGAHRRRRGFTPCDFSRRRC